MEASDPEIVVREGVFSGDVSVRGGYVYYAASGCRVDVNESIRRFPADTIGPTVTTLGVEAHGAAGFTTTTNALFVLAWESDASPPYPTDVTTQPLTGGASTIVAAGQASAQTIITDGANLYWQFDGGATLAAMPVGGQTPPTFVSAEELGVDGVALGVAAVEGLFFVTWTATNHTLRVLPRGTSGPAQLVYQLDDGGFSGINLGALGEQTLVESGGDICFVQAAPSSPPISESVTCVSKSARNIDVARTLGPAVPSEDIFALAADDAALYWMSVDAEERNTLYRVVK